MKRHLWYFFILLIGFWNCQSHQKPNIVFFLIDDLGWKDVSYMSSEYYETPNIDKLASQGMIFTNAYANAANCAPTRASLLTGQYTPRHGVFTVSSSERGLSADRRLIPIQNSTDVNLDKITIAEALKTAGYVSAAIGKWHIGHSPEDHGFDVSIQRQEIGYRGGHFSDDGEYLTDRLTHEAEKFIIEHKDTSFFLCLAHYAVHTPIQAKEEIIEKYSIKEGIGCHNDPTYAAMIQSVDESIGRVTSLLEELNLSKNTVVIFFSDNGGYGPKTCMRPLRGGKGMYYEGGIREPMIVKWPGRVNANSVSHVPVISTDFYPTILQITGAQVPPDYILDGLSLLPLIEGKEKLDRNKLFWHFPAYLESYEGLKEDSRDTLFRTRPVSVVLKDDWKLLMFHEEWSLDGGRENIEKNNAIELYNLKEDISENINLVNIEIAKRDELLNDLINWQNEIHAPIPNTPNPDFNLINSNTINKTE